MNGEEKIRNQKLWYARIEEMLSSDISQKQWCQNNGININSMYYWLRKYNNDKAMRDQPFSLAGAAARGSHRNSGLQ
ncbi:MAG: hypothetical protein LKE86_08295 [Eubacterium sp.]|jgi:transposase-like protein|nr:hypothetical protein [Eubacterium sp.]MCH4047407.1 hypothetical protein [Eubacterium sp.]MCH4080504.1 hypothetical protein [Eubacterium sp.]